MIILYIKLNDILNSVENGEIDEMQLSIIEDL